jgi:hypothetical protein
MSLSIKLLLSICVLVLFSCSSNDFDYEEAVEFVNLTEDDLNLFSKLNEYVLEDIVVIRKEMKPLLPEGIDTVFLSTNPYYLNRLDSSKYFQIIHDLKEKDMFTGMINCSYYGTVKFELKEMTEMKWDDFNETYIHELVFDNSDLEKPRKHSILDSVLRENVNYVFYNVQTGW